MNTDITTRCGPLSVLTFSSQSGIINASVIITSKAATKRKLACGNRIAIASTTGVYVITKKPATVAITPAMFLVC